MKKNLLIARGPFTHENLTLFILEGGEQLDGSRYRVLSEAMEAKEILIHETGTVGQLEAQNLSPGFDVFIQAGDLVKGGRQDRILGVDFIVPANSGRIPVPAFCVESGRWHRRRREADSHFSSSSHAVHYKSTRLAAKFMHSQQAVWKEIDKSQKSLSGSVGESVYSMESPTSYCLSVEHPALRRKKESYQANLRSIIEGMPSAVGYAFYVNGERNSIDIYGSSHLFRKLWDKLLNVAILEAIGSESPSSPKGLLPTSDDFQSWVQKAGKAQVKEDRNIPPRARIVTSAHDGQVIFETYDSAVSDVVVHTNIISSEKAQP